MTEEDIPKVTEVVNQVAEYESHVLDENEEMMNEDIDNYLFIPKELSSRLIVQYEKVPDPGLKHLLD
jgi:hypothetical protein